MLLFQQKYLLTLARYQPGHRFLILWRGKSGQQRATHRLSAGYLNNLLAKLKKVRESATENNCLF